MSDRLAELEAERQRVIESLKERARRDREQAGKRAQLAALVDERKRVNE